MRTARIKEGFGMIQRDIMTSESVSALSKSLYALLVSYAGEKSTCYPSINTICKNLCLSKPTIIKCINELKKENLIIVQKRITKNGDYGNNVYEPLYLIEEVVNEVYYPSQLDLLGVVKEVYPKNNSIKNNIYSSFTFEEFWKMYPKKVGKDVSEKIFNKLPEKDLLEIKRTLLAFISNKPFATYNHPNPATYLNQKRWLDEIPDGVPYNQGEDEQGYTPQLLN